MTFAVVKRKKILISFMTALSVCALILAVYSTGAYVVAAGKTTRRLPIYCVDRTDNKVAISFDASWGAERTEQIISTVQEYGVKANFFAVNLWVEKYPDMLKKIADSGAFEIGLHSATHPHMSKLSRAEMQQELRLNFAAIERVTGIKARLFRPPFGEYSDTLLEVAEQEGLITVQWDVDSLDWKGLSAGEIAGRVVSKAKSGSIILLHNDGEHTAEALPAIIEGLKNKGLELVTISELIYPDGYHIDHTGKQIKTNT